MENQLNILKNNIIAVIGINGLIGSKTARYFSKENFTLRKLMDVSKLKEMGWESKIDLKKGMLDTVIFKTF